MDKARLASQLRISEGVRHDAYRDSLGFWTAGVGHLLDQSIDWTGVVFSDEQIAIWLVADIASALDKAGCLPEYPHLDTDARQNAVVELVFNLGLAHWRQFAHARLAMCRQDWTLAKAQLLDSIWAKQVGVDRSTRIANQILTGEF